MTDTNAEEYSVIDTEVFCAERSSSAAGSQDIDATGIGEHATHPQHVESTGQFGAQHRRH